MASFGAVLIAISGVVNIVLGARIGALIYEAYPGGKLGHVGILAGVAAIAIGMVLWFFIVPLHGHKSRRNVRMGGVLTIVLGHIGAVAGALFIGTAGVVVCYISGIWAIVAPKVKSK